MRWALDDVIFSSDTVDRNYANWPRSKNEVCNKISLQCYCIHQYNKKNELLHTNNSISRFKEISLLQYLTNIVDGTSTWTHFKNLRTRSLLLCQMCVLFKFAELSSVCRGIYNFEALYGNEKTLLGCSFLSTNNETIKWILQCVYTICHRRYICKSWFIRISIIQEIYRTGINLNKPTRVIMQISIVKLAIA